MSEQSTIIKEIGNRLLTQDNRMTADPMFCVQIKRRIVGMDSEYSYNLCWVDSANNEVIHSDDPNFKEKPSGDEWDEFGFVDYWETVMVAFTEEGCREYMRLDGHNCKLMAHGGEVRIYAMSFRRCPEMLSIREMLKECPK